MSVGALPQNAGGTAIALAVLADELAFLGGDRSTDLAWYGKRAAIAGIYASTGDEKTCMYAAINATLDTAADACYCSTVNATADSMYPCWDVRGGNSLTLMWHGNRGVIAGMYALTGDRKPYVYHAIDATVDGSNIMYATSAVKCYC